MGLGELKLRASPWIAFLLGTILVAWAFVEKGRNVSFGDLYPGVALFAAGIILRAFVKWCDGPAAKDSTIIERQVDEPR
jgi:hypothetical protein